MIKIVSTIKKSRDSLSRPWIVSTAAVDTIDNGSQSYASPVKGASDLALTFADAIEIAAEQREAIDGMLMDSVYRDRMERREAATA